jgi:hypothetical protein
VPTYMQSSCRVGWGFPRDHNDLLSSGPTGEWPGLLQSMTCHEGVPDHADLRRTRGVAASVLRGVIVCMLGLVYLLFVYMQLDETSGWAFAIVAASTSAIGAVLSWRLGPAVGLAVASFLAVPPEEIRYWNDHSIGNLGEVVLFLGTLFISHEYLRSIDRGNQLVSALYVYSGAKSIVARLRHRRAGDEGLPTGVLWLLGVYSAVYGLASQRYDGRVADIESRSTAVFSKISTRGDTGTRAFALVPLQHMRCPVKPVFWPPNHTPLQSILADTLLESNVVEWGQTVELWKDSLVDVDFGSMPRCGKTAPSTR